VSVSLGDEIRERARTDAVWTAHLDVDTLAIFSVVTDELKLRRLHGACAFTEVEF
jgi:hypothetical protein